MLGCNPIINLSFMGTGQEAEVAEGGSCGLTSLLLLYSLLPALLLLKVFLM